VCIWKKAGYTSQEIAGRRGTTAGAVDTMLSRIRQKVRDLMDTPGGAAPQDALAEREVDGAGPSHASRREPGSGDGS
jgi:hypothetical protein